MTTLQEAARDALEALERIGKDFVCRSAHHAKKDQHSAFAECPVVVRHTDAIESLRTALAQQGERKNCPQPEICGSKECEFCRDTAAPAPQAQPDWLLKTTQDLANSIRRRCYPEVPQFEVLDDLAGVISQIDNMTTGMERKAAPQPAQRGPVAEVVVQNSGRFTINVHLLKPEDQFTLPAGTYPLYMQSAQPVAPQAPPEVDGGEFVNGVWSGKQHHSQRKETPK